ncbi:MAG: hypothetical protein IPM38_05720 [Ignavibacteria bacterium]|nr:hypothetical protein [Ignavibacteria bacterium]
MCGDEFVTVFFEKVPIEGKVENFIKNYIKKNINILNDLNIIFKIITYCYPDKRIYFLKYLFETKPEFKNFENLYLDKQSWSGSGSLIPAYEKCKLFWEDVEHFMLEINKPNFLGFVGRNIENYESRIKYELKRDFIEED